MAYTLDEFAADCRRSPAGARFVRVTGTNLENIARRRYNSEAGTMVVEKRPNFRAAA